MNTSDTPATTPQGHVLILGARAPVCLEWARAFHASGWRVCVADSLAWPLSRASRAVDACVRLPEPRQDPAAWGAALAEVIRQRDIGVLLPTCEEVFYLAHVQALGLLPVGCRVLTSGFELLHRLHHKGRFAALTAGWPIEAPPTRTLTSAAELQALRAEPGFRAADWVFKPAYSRFATRTLIRPTDATVQATVQPAPTQHWVAQRFVAGREHCSFSLLSQGRLTAHACYHPRHRVGRGSGIWFEPTDPPALRAFVERFGQETGYTGQVGFDVIEDAQGRCHVLECNPRGTSGAHLFDDQPQALVRALLDTPAAGTPVLSPTPHPRMVGLAMLLFAFPDMLVRRPAGLGALWRDTAAARDVIARPGDPGPLTAQLVGVAEIAARALRRRSGLLAASSADIEWDGQPL